jgi:hypothetical protein
MKRMKRSLAALFLGAALSLVPIAQAQGQVILGVHGTISEIRQRTAAGLGARAGVVLRNQRDFVLVLEGVGEYLWPSCDIADCGATHFQGNFIGRMRLPSFGEAYGGMGLAYQKFTVDDGEQTYKGDDWGLNLLVGSQAGSPGGTRPFIEVRYSFMRDVSNQFGLSLGVRLPVGG